MVNKHRRKAFRASSSPAASISFVSAGAVWLNGDTYVPSGIVAGDLLIAFQVADGAGTVSIPSGWTRITPDKIWDSYNYATTIAYKIATSSEPSTYRFHNFATGRTSVMVAYRGATTITPGTWTTQGSTISPIGVSGTGTLVSLASDRFAASLTIPAGTVSRVSGKDGGVYLLEIADIINDNLSKTWGNVVQGVGINIVLS